MVDNVSKLAVLHLDWVKMCKALQHNKWQAFLLLKRPTTKAAYKDKENIYSCSETLALLALLGPSSTAEDYILVGDSFN